jgi:hypothetical protein
MKEDYTFELLAEVIFCASKAGVWQRLGECVKVEGLHQGGRAYLLRMKIQMAGRQRQLLEHCHASRVTDTEPSEIPGSHVSFPALNSGLEIRLT